MRTLMLMMMKKKMEMMRMAVRMKSSKSLNNMLQINFLK